MKQTYQKDQAFQAPFPFMGQGVASGLAEELLANLRQCFLFNAGKHSPMQILAQIEDEYPETEKDCDMLRISLRMVKDIGAMRVLPMRRHHCGRIAAVMQASPAVAETQRLTATYHC